MSRVAPLAAAGYGAYFVYAYWTGALYFYIHPIYILPTVATGARVCNVYQTDRKEWAKRKLPALEQQIVVSGFA